MTSLLHPRLREQILPRISRRNALQFLHQIPHALVRRWRHDDLYFHVLIATRTVPGAGHAFFFQAQGLSAVRSGRNSHQRPAINRRHFNLGPQGGLAHRHGNFRVQIISAPLEELMGLGDHAQVQIARRSAHRPRVAFSRNAYSRAVCDSGRYAYIDRLRAPHPPFAPARLADGSQLARSAAARARHVELHLAGLLLDRPRSVAGWARLRRADGAGSMTGFAGIQARDGEFLHRAAHGIPKVNLDLIFQVAARFVLRFHRGASPAAAEKLAEEITEARSAARGSGPAAEIVAAEVKINIRRFAVLSRAGARSTGRHIVAVKAVLVVDLPLLRVGEHVVRFLQLFEFFFRGLVAGIQVRMILPRQLAERRANILCRRFARHSQQFVIILLCCRRHRGSRKILAGATAPAGCAPAIATSTQFGRLLSSTSTYSASITSPGFLSCAPPEPAELPPLAPAPAAAPACPALPAACAVLYRSSAILCSERSTFSFAERSRATPPSLMAFFASSIASSAFFTSASAIFSRFSRIIFSAW